MTSRMIIRGYHRLSTTLLSNHSSPLHNHQPPLQPPPQQPLTTYPFHNPFIPPQLHLQNSTTPFSLTTLLRQFSTSSSSSTASTTDSTTATSSNGSNSTINGDNMKHQEIEGPTVERDLSPLANETREVTNTLLKTMYNVSTFFALLGLAHLALGAYSYTITSSSSSASAWASSALPLMNSVLAFGFPFSMAFMLRQSLKSMHFFEKMEKIGRLQILTSTMQIFKHLRLFFVRVRALSFLCLAGLSFSFLYSLSSSL